MQAPQKLRRWRERHNVTQTNAAARIGCTQGMLSKWELGKNIPSTVLQRSVWRVTDHLITPNDWVLPDEVDQ